MNCKMSSSSATIAVIIPVYRGAKTLGAAIDSVLSQTYNDFELWLVDDGSPDESGAIIDNYARQDARIRVIHKTNEGCYHARLSALRVTKAPFFAFVDQDDVAEPTLLEELLKFLQDNNLDVAQCDHAGAAELGAPNELYLSRSDVINGFLYDSLLAGGDQVTMWGKLYRNQYDFSTFSAVEQVTAFEDMIYNLQLLCNVNRVGVLHKGLYRYIINEGSSVRNFSLRRLAEFQEAYRIRKLWLPRYGINEDAAALLNAKWFVKNMQNALITAATAPVSKLSCRYENMAAILSVDGLGDVLNMLNQNRERLARGRLLLEIARRVPVPLLVVLLQSITCLQRLLKFKR